MSSFACVITIIVTVRESASLKDKRSVVRSIVDGLGKRKGIAAAETGLRDNVKSAELTVAVVGDSPGFVDSEARAIIEEIESKGELMLSVMRLERY